MKKIIYLYILIVLLSLLIISCQLSDWSTFTNAFSNITTTTISDSTTTINDFDIEIIKQLTNRDSDDQFGTSVSLSDNYLAVGIPNEDGGDSNPISEAGAVIIYESDGNGYWNEVNLLNASDYQTGDNFGYSVSISGNYLAIGAPYEDGGNGDPLSDCGAVYIYERNGSGNWNETAILHASDKESWDNFGSSVTLNGNYLIVGTPYEDGGWGSPTSEAGAVYIYERDGSGNWNETGILHASDKESGDSFGYSVTLDSNYLAIGAPCEDGGSVDSTDDTGAVYVFERDGSGNWNETAILHLSDKKAWDNFGYSVSISGNYLAIGTPYDDPGSISDAGEVYVYKRDDTGNWNHQTTLSASDKQEWDNFGSSVSLYGNYLAVGAPYEDGGNIDPTDDTGAVYLFVFDASTNNWQEKKIFHASDKAKWNGFGKALSINNNYLISGAPTKEIEGVWGAGCVYIYE